jgi:hypothetical protein
VNQVEQPAERGPIGCGETGGHLLLGAPGERDEPGQLGVPGVEQGHQLDPAAGPGLAARH